MKLQILQPNLAKGVALATRFTSAKAQLPVLGNILISARKTKLYIMSTNLEISVSAGIGAKIEEDGNISIPSKVLNDLISNLPNEPIEIQAEKEQMKITVGTFSSTVVGMSGEDFPKIPGTIPKENSVNLPKTDFANALSQVIFAVSTDETRPVLTGVLVFAKGAELTLVATDGFRLSRKIIKVAGSPDLKLILPKAILTEIVKDAGSGESILFNFSEKDKQALFGVDDIVFTSRLLEGDYPDYEKIIPKSSTITARLDKEDFGRAVKLASVFARDAANIIKIKVLKDGLKISAEGGSGSQEAKVDAKVEKQDGDFEISFNFRYVEDFLHSIKGSEVLLEFNGPDAAGVFKDTSDTSYLHLIMPIRSQS